jgi:outer membrane protein
MKLLRYVGLASLFTLSSIGPSAQAFSLATAVEEALRYDAAFLSAQKKAEADATLSGQGLGRLLPTAQATASRSRTDFDVAGSSNLDYSGRYSNSYGLRLTQPLFRLDSFAEFSQLRERAVAGASNFAQAKSDLLLRVTQAYFDVLIAQDSLASVNAELKAISEQLESAKRAFEVGTATVTDQQEAQARFDLATAKQIAAENELSVKRNALAQTVGRPSPARLSGLKTGVVLAPPAPLDVSPWVEQARSAGFRVRAAESASRIAQSEVTRVIAADNLPSVNLVAERRRSEPFRATGQPNFDRADTTVVAIEMTLPLFNGGVAINRAREIMALRDKAAFDLENERRQAEQQARTAYLGVLSGLTQVKAFEAAEKSSRLALESNILGYEVGVRINIDVLNAQQQLFATQRDLSKARYDTLLSSLRLKQAAGALTESDISDINSLLQ